MSGLTTLGTSAAVWNQRLPPLTEISGTPTW